ncbi:hypothetical protein ABIA54_001078 [Pseudomonas sp. EB276 TE3739]|uniref:hypothetical protein n=1 Tax=Pseudomonas TaxID=286 RepID=UPI00209F7F8A|nr:hypothetical protein [Pseudomonas koreensis]MCP1474832.1 hypothetical protein [Pseudomonas koreensis]
MAERYFDVASFSTMFATAGVWLGQTVSIQLWLFWVAGIGATLAIAFGIWSLSDKRHGVIFAKNEQDKAFATAEEATSKLKMANAELDRTKLELGVTRKDLDTVSLELEAAYAKIAELRTPALPPMTEDQDKVIAVIATYDSEGKECPAKEFPGRIGLNLLEADGAMDVLAARKLIEFQYYNDRRYVTLTAKGRAYVLHPDFWMPQMPS